MMRRFIKIIIGPILRKICALYLRKPRKYSYRKISVVVAPTVFPPFITISTKLLLEFIEKLPLNGKTFLELGCGCGIISILAAKKGAFVTATDITRLRWKHCKKMLTTIPSPYRLCIRICLKVLKDHSTL